MIAAAILALVAVTPTGPDTVSPMHPCECRDLPRLFAELMEQEKLRELCQEYLKGKPDEEFLSNKEVSERLQWRLDQFVNGRAGQSASGASAGGGAAPAFGTNYLHPECGLMKYPPKDAAGNQPDPVPSSPDEVRARNCSAISEFILDHEKLHQDRCAARFRKEGHGRSLLIPSNYLKEDIEAYQEGIKRLRREMASLARECGWKGSSKKFKQGGLTVVPTADQVQQLKDAVKKKAQALRMGAAR